MVQQVKDLVGVAKKKKKKVSLMASKNINVICNSLSFACQMSSALYLEATIAITILIYH